MATQNIVQEIILNTNSSQILCKPIVIPSKSLGKYICAFSNTEGGYILFGVVLDGKDVDIVGLSGDFYSNELIDKAINLLNPKPKLETKFLYINNRKVIIVKILKSDETIFFEQEEYTMEENEITKHKGVAILDRTKVFIVHGHDKLAQQETARFIESLGLKAIILHEQASSGGTIIEKIETYSNVGFAIILYTPCDLGKAKDEKEFKARARQNVVFEHGYLMGKIGRKNVCALVKSQVEKPNDISGVVYIDMDEGGAWKHMLIREMKNAGYNIDANKLFD